jgi:peptide/nickel transport system substrate-binding protein
MFFHSALNKNGERRKIMERGQKGWIRIFVVLFVLGIFLFHSADTQAAPRGEIKIAIHSSISADWLDPATTGFSLSANMPLYLIHDGLVKAMPDGLYTPCLAESWTMSPDAKTLEFRLRRGVKFHNGETVTAEDVAFSFWRYKAAQAKFIHGKTEKVEAVNPNLIRFRFKEPFPDFLDYLLAGASSIGWVVPKKVLEKEGEAGFKRHPIGCGPYKFVEFKPGVKLVVEAFEGYWRKVPAIKRIELLVIRDAATRLAMVRRGEADIATLMQGVFYEDAKKDPKIRLLTPLSSTVWLVNIGAQWDPKSPWSDPRVRKAASLAIDRQTLADVHMPGCTGAGGIAMPGDPLGVEIPPDPYDPAKAKKLLADAGFPNGFQGGKFYPYEGGYWPYGEQVAKAVGISVDIVLLDRPAWLATREGGKMKGSLCVDYGIAPTIGGRLSYLFGKNSFGNYPDIQSAWDQYQKAVDPKERKELIGQVQKKIHEKAMFLPLTSTNSPAAFSLRIKGNPYKIQPLIWFPAPFEDMELAQ